MRQYKQYKSTVSSQITKIATLAVSIGIASILIAIATSKGLQREIQLKTSVFNGHIRVTLFENNESQISVLPLKDSQEVVNAIEAQKNIFTYHAYATKAGMLKSNEEFEGILFKGVSEKMDWTLLEDFLVEGSFPVFSDANKEGILISRVLAQRLKLSIGDRVDSYFQNENNPENPRRRRYIVQGIYASGFPEIDENLVMGSLEQIQRLNSWAADEIGGYEIFIRDFKELLFTSDKLYDALPSDLDSISIADRYSSIYQWISLFDFNVLVILVVMLLVGVINMATALLVLILERSRMVGVLKALGAENQLIQRIFLLNGAVILLRGLFWGNSLGLLFYFSQKYWGWIQLDPESYFVEKAPVLIEVFDLIALNAFFLLISLVLLWIPSRIILRISPTKTLRFR